MRILTRILVVVNNFFISLFSINTKKNPLVFTLGGLSLYSVGLFGPQVQAPIPGVWLSAISKRETPCQLHDAGIVFLYESFDNCVIEVYLP